MGIKYFYGLINKPLDVGGIKLGERNSSQYDRLLLRILELIQTLILGKKKGLTGKR